MNTLTALIISFLFAGIMVYVIEKYFGGTDDNEPIL
jgi:hypothetical protein